ncbi:hypothetical protein [Sphingosinicella rhizophila]|uniref:Uncharacterized protein n=1 Tax=Sphingosinicella rhizophila TaxID=3050082 RepID=A0ABU3Q6Q2_9SPHN|nr:hypothetical protein [Sphingosinicella sp. GR2756]MDT9598992.1 hypothetical protein [Sphingosinicella sp. GR2756]
MESSILHPPRHVFRRGRRGAARTRTLLIAGVALTGATPAFAQYPPPGSVAPPGSITISRDVPQRPAFDPGQPGTVNAVNTAPVDLIFGATQGLVSILSDDETAGVSSGVEVQRGALGIALGDSDAALNSQFDSSPGQIAAGSFGGVGLGSTITNSIGAATGAIGRALQPLASGRGD